MIRRQRWVEHKQAAAPLEAYALTTLALASFPSSRPQSWDPSILRPVVDHEPNKLERDHGAKF